MSGAPCKDCPRRHELCHMDCEEYQAFRRQKDAVNETEHEKYRLKRDCSELMYAKRLRSEQKRWRK